MSETQNSQVPMCKCHIPQENIGRLCIHPQLSHRITYFWGEKLVYLSWTDSERQSRNKIPSKCPNVCTRYENKLLTSTRSCKGDYVTQIEGLLWCKSSGKSQPGWWQSVETSFSHHEEGLSLKLVCLWQGPHVIIKKDFWCGLPPSEEWAIADGGGLQ